MTEFQITNTTELFLLQRALLEAKLPRLANDNDLAASPIVASLAARVTEACSEAPDLASVGERWRDFSPQHSYWSIAISRALVDQDYLRKSEPAKREEYVRWLIAPFRTDEPIIREFLAELDSILETRRWYHLWIRTKSPFGGGVAIIRERTDGSFIALDAAQNEIASSRSQGHVVEILLERGLEPFGYFVEEASPTEQGAAL